MSVALTRPTGAALMALGAAFLWASYYPLVLGVPNGPAPSALMVWPFLVGGLAYTLVAIRAGHRDAFLGLWSDRRAWGRVALMVPMQLAVLASTYLAGAVDTSLLALVADVVLTPLFLSLLFSEGRQRFRSGVFLGGLGLCTAGAVLTIVAGGAVRPLSGAEWLVAPFVALVVALYFVITARAALTTPTTAVVGQVTLASGIVVLVMSPLLPGGFTGLLPPNPGAAAALVAIGLTSFFAGPILYFGAIERAGLVLPAVLMAAIPVFTLLLSWGLLGSVPPPIGLLGIPLAVIGAVAALRGENAPWTPTYRGIRPDEGEVRIKGSR